MIPLFAFHPHWRLIFWLSYSAWGLFEIWVFSRDRRAAQGQKQDGGSLYVIIGLLLLGIFGAFAAPHMAPFARMRLPAMMVFSTAIALVWAGLVLRLWAIVTLGRFFRTSVLIQDEHRLVTAGPYRLLRHPAYTGSLLTITGIGAAMGNWLSILSAFGFAAAGCAWRIHVEERALRQRFGAAFDHHRTRTWAVIPFVW